MAELSSPPVLGAMHFSGGRRGLPARTSGRSARPRDRFTWPGETFPDNAPTYPSRSSGTVSIAGMDAESHRCPLDGAANDVIDPDWCSSAFESILRGLPTPLTSEDVTSEELLLFRDADVEVFFAPFDHVNPSARVALVGITPGREQARVALAVASAELRAGADLGDALARAKSAAAFAGPMRRNLVRMLDEIGLAAALGIVSCDDLFHEQAHLVTTTSVICHPVFVRGGENYRGSSPRLDRHPLLRAFAEHVLAATLASVPEAPVVPLGVAAGEGVRLAGVDTSRVLAGLPHPSGGNGHRVASFTRERDQLTATVSTWAGKVGRLRPDH